MENMNENAGIELLLAHMKLEDFIEAMGSLYPSEDSAALEGSSLYMSQGEMDENEEISSPAMLENNRSSMLRDSVRYGTVDDLLAFANQLSNSPGSKPTQETGVLLNKVSPTNKHNVFFWGGVALKVL
uniref:Uncharacterized protein n=1 Tax=Erpetoichthys calabaricus TaxID=27687 RepID=A0A8C4RXV5_ERPCA